LSRSRRISIGWKTQSLRFPRPKAQEAPNIFWTGDHNGPLVFVRLRAIRGIFSTCNAFAKEVF
jgi:hypothetical protein